MFAIVRWDETVFRAIHVDLRQPWLDPVMLGFSKSGLGEVIAAACLLSLFWKQARPFGLGTLVAYALSGILRNVIAHPMDRVRPSNFPFAQPMEEIYLAPSFPSGHATAAFSVGVFLWLATRGGAKPWIGWAALVWAALTAFSRVYIGVHFVTDIVAGAALGACVASAVYLFMTSRGWLPSQSPR